MTFGHLLRPNFTAPSEVSASLANSSLALVGPTCMRVRRFMAISLSCRGARPATVCLQCHSGRDKRPVIQFTSFMTSAHVFCCAAA